MEKVARGSLDVSVTARGPERHVCRTSRPTPNLLTQDTTHSAAPLKIARGSSVEGEGGDRGDDNSNSQNKPPAAKTNFNNQDQRQRPRPTSTTETNANTIVLKCMAATARVDVSLVSGARAVW